MDSSDIQCSSSSSISSNLGCEKAAMIRSKRAKFFSTYQPQEFSFLDSIMFYIAKNPTSPEVYQKMVQSCKDFFVKNPILVISKLVYFGGEKWEIPVGNRNKCPSDLSKITSKLWILDGLFVLPGIPINKKAVNQNILSSVMPKIYQCAAKSVIINDQTVSFHDLSRLISFAEEIRIFDATVKDENNSNIALETVVEVAVKAKRIIIWSDTAFLNVTTETMKELIKLPNFSKLDRFILNGVPEAFDLETFYAYMKKHKTIKISLSFDDSISEAYQNRLEGIIDEILATENRGYKAPYIYFPGLDGEKADKLDHIHWSH